jgi:hypothetical protein
MYAHVPDMCTYAHMVASSCTLCYLHHKKVTVRQGTDMGMLNMGMLSFRRPLDRNGVARLAAKILAYVSVCTPYTAEHSIQF